MSEILSTKTKKNDVSQIWKEILFSCGREVLHRNPPWFEVIYVALNIAIGLPSTAATTPGCTLAAGLFP